MDEEDLLEGKEQDGEGEWIRIRWGEESGGEENEPG